MNRDFGIALREQWCEWYGCYVTFNLLRDTKPMFKVRDDSLNTLGKNDRDFCVYFVYNGSGKIIYIGKGRYWDYHIYGWNVFWRSRPFIHDDFMSDQITSDCKIAIIHAGVTDLEARLLEALYIFQEVVSGRTLTKQKAEIWDGESLINKKREMVSDFYDVASVYLNDWIWKSLKTYCLKASRR